MTHMIAELRANDRPWYLGIQYTGIFDSSIDVDKGELEGQSRAKFSLWRIASTKVSPE